MRAKIQVARRRISRELIGPCGTHRGEMVGKGGKRIHRACTATNDIRGRIRAADSDPLVTASKGVIEQNLGRIYPHRVDPALLIGRDETGHERGAGTTARLISRRTPRTHLFERAAPRRGPLHRNVSEKELHTTGEDAPRKD